MRFLEPLNLAQCDDRTLDRSRCSDSKWTRATGERWAKLRCSSRHPPSRATGRPKPVKCFRRSRRILFGTRGSITSHFAVYQEL